MSTFMDFHADNHSVIFNPHRLQLSGGAEHSEGARPLTTPPANATDSADFTPDEAGFDHSVYEAEEI
jgi:hypothetical protein